jgi:hypothetical protein
VAAAVAELRAVARRPRAVAAADGSGAPKVDNDDDDDEDEDEDDDEDALAEIETDEGAEDAEGCVAAATCSPADEAPARLRRPRAFAPPPSIDSDDAAAVGIDAIDSC